MMISSCIYVYIYAIYPHMICLNMLDTYVYDPFNQSIYTYIIIYVC